MLCDGEAAARDGDSARALDLFDAVVAEFGASVEYEARDCVARALGAKASVLQALGRREEYASVLDELLARDSAATEPTLVDHATVALARKADLLHELGRFDEELPLRDDLVSRYALRSPSERPLAVLEELCDRMWLLQKLGRRREAIAACDVVLAQAGGATAALVRRKAVMALLIKAQELTELGEYTEALIELDQLFSEAGDPDTFEPRSHVAQAFWQRGLALWNIDMHDAAVAAFDDLLRGFSEATEPRTADVVTFALQRKALHLEAEGQRVEAIALYGLVFQRSLGSKRAIVRQRGTEAAINKARLLAADRNSEEALNTLGAAIDELDRAATDARRLQLLGQVLYERLKLLAGIDRLPDAVATADLIVERLGDSPDREARVLVARALLDRTIGLSMLGRWSEAESGFERLVGTLSAEALEALDHEAATLEADDDEGTRERLAAALQLKAVVLSELGREAESHTAFEAVITRFEDDPDPNIAAIVLVARELQGQHDESDL